MKLSPQCGVNQRISPRTKLWQFTPAEDPLLSWEMIEMMQTLPALLCSDRSLTVNKKQSQQCFHLPSVSLSRIPVHFALAWECYELGNL